MHPILYPMKSKLLILFLLLTSFTSHAQIAGSWRGKLNVTSAYALTLVLHITEEDNQLSATLDSPDQGATGIAISSIDYDTATQQLTFESTVIGARYQGTLKNDTIQGIFVQRGMPLRLDLAREEMNKPEELLPYNSKEVSITSGDVILSGTITSPKEGGKPVAILLVAGSGPNNRDSQIAQHKPLYDIADYLTKEGYTVLRYDKRGVGKSTGTFAASMLSDLRDDAVVAAQYLRNETQYSKIGIIGHSEGGLIAEMIAAETPKIADFIVLLAAPGVSGIETIVYQNEVMMAHLIDPKETEAFRLVTQEVMSEIAYNTQSRSEDSLLMRAYFDKVLPMVKEDMRAQTKQMVESDQFFTANLNGMTPYYKGFLRTEPTKYLSRISCPILAINGSKDMQVEAIANLGAIRKLTRQAEKVTIVEVEGLNHLFLLCETGLPQEYLYLQPGFAPEVLRIIADWLPKE